jgi:hypothetical protein
MIVSISKLAKELINKKFVDIKISCGCDGNTIFSPIKKHESMFSIVGFLAKY